MKFNKALLCTIMLSCLFEPAKAKNLGSIGTTWEIQEQSILAFIEQRLHEQFDGKSEEEIKAEVQKRVEENVLRPPYVELPRATEDSERTFDPSFTVERDLADHKGQVFAKKGQVINPFDHIPFDRTLIFIDGDDEEQVKWVKNFKAESTVRKVILTKGNIRDMNNLLDEWVYFDQNATLINRFGIKALPTVIDEKKGQKLFRIREFKL